MINGANRDQRVAIIPLGIAVIWLCAQLIYLDHKKEVADREQVDMQRVTSILQGISDDYIFLIDVNLVTVQEEQFSLSDTICPTSWSRDSNDYTHCIQHYASAIIDADDRQHFLEDTKLSNLKHVLSQQSEYVITYTANVGGRPHQLQGCFTINHDHFSEPHMDVQMPKTTGYGAAMAIRRSKNPLGQTIPIVAMTVNAFSEDVQQSIGSGMDAHISKPIDISVLEKTMRSLVTPQPR